MIWVTRARPVIDRVACPWLIVRFHDKDAQFVFLPTDEVLRTAGAVDGIAFDIPGGRYEHDGALCTFDVLLRELGPHDDPALARLADIVRAADTDRLDDVPQAAGLLALALGLRRLHERDAAQLEAGLAIYDALYAWCRHDTAERHNWKRSDSPTSLPTPS
jgi:hypothetical protein